MHHLLSVALLLSAVTQEPGNRWVAEAVPQPADCTIHCHSNTTTSEQCNKDLGSTAAWERIFATSGVVLNSMGDYFQCTHNTTSVLQERSGYQMCILDILDASGTYTTVTQGLCLPQSCQAAPIQRMLEQLGRCNLTIASYLDKCVEPGYVQHCNGTAAGCVRGYKETKEAVSRAWNLFVSLNKKNRGPIEFHCGDHKLEGMGTGTVIMAVFTSILLFLCILSEAVQSWEKRQVLTRTSAARTSVNMIGRPGSDASTPLIRVRLPPQTCRINSKFLQAFCLSSNFDTLFEQHDQTRIPALDGLRSLSLLWIIFAHTSKMTTELGTDNQNAVALASQSLPLTFSLGANLAIDTFFFQLGHETTRVLLRRMEKKRKAIAWVDTVTFLVIRYLRLTPLYAYLLFFYAYLVPYFGQGPVWYRMTKGANMCAAGGTWWTNLLYFNNFYPQSFQDSCMPWSWYLACDMQFFIVGLMILTIYLRVGHRIGMAFAVLLTAGGVFCGWWVLDKTHRDPQNNFFDKPYSRVTPFTVGIIMGILLVDWKIDRKRLSGEVSTIFMLLALAVITVVMYIDYINFHPTLNEWSSSASASFQSFGRLAFAVSMAAITWLCISGNSRLVNWWLSLNFWEPMGKLTLGAYLVHPIIIRSFYFQQVALFHFVPFNRMVVFIAMAVISYSVAIALYLLVELPFANLQKRFLLLLRSRKFCC